MSKKNGKYKTVGSYFILITMISGSLLGIALFLFLVLYPSNVKTSIWAYVGIAAIGVVPLPVLSICLARRIFTIIVIDENGISRSLFGKFYKLTMSWDEIHEICYQERVFPFLIFSKTQSVHGLSDSKRNKIKDMIMLQLTVKNSRIVRQYIKQPVVGMSEQSLAALRKHKLWD